MLEPAETPPSESTPLVPAGPGSETPREASGSDIIRAVAAVPAVDTLLTNLQTQARDIVERDWDRLSTGGRIVTIAATAIIGGGALAGVLSHPETRQAAFDLLNGRTFPVPGVEGLQFEVGIRGNDWTVGLHLDVGALLPASLGFGPSSPSAFGLPSIPEGGSESESGTTVQRQMEEPQLQRQLEEGEELRTKELPGQTPEVTSDLEARINAIRGGGQPLPVSTRAFFEPRFGYNFSQVRVHSDVEADKLNSSLNAQAFITGQDIFFRQGAYNPSSSSGLKLLAHELTHVVQQNGGKVQRKLTIGQPGDIYEKEEDRVAEHVMQMPEPQVQRQPEEEETVQTKKLGLATPNLIRRKIVVGGKDYTPTAKYLKWLKDNYSDAMVEFVTGMHNSGNPPEYKFDSYQQMGYEVKVRHNAIKGMEEVHKGCCSYPPGGGTGNLDSTYWDKKGPFQFTVKSPLPSDKKASDAIEAIFKSGAGTELECNSMMVAIQYRAMLKALRKSKFNSKFPGGSGIIISPHHVPPAGVTRHPIWEKKLYKHITISSAADLLPGDWVYFKNISDYISKHPGGAWSGEHAMYLGGGKFRGFGVSELTEAKMNEKLLEAYNAGLPTTHRKTPVDVPGLQNYARRPVIKEITK